MALYRGWDPDAFRMPDAPSDKPDGHRYREESMQRAVYPMASIHLLIL